MPSFASQGGLILLFLLLLQSALVPINASCNIARDVFQSQELREHQIKLLTDLIVEPKIPVIDAKWISLTMAIIDEFTTQFKDKPNLAIHYITGPTSAFFSMPKLLTSDPNYLPIVSILCPPHASPTSQICSNIHYKKTVTSIVTTSLYHYHHHTIMVDEWIQPLFPMDWSNAIIQKFQRIHKLVTCLRG